MSEPEVLWEGEVRSQVEYRKDTEQLRVAGDGEGGYEVQARHRQGWDHWGVCSSSHGPDMEDTVVTIARELRDLREAARASVALVVHNGGICCRTCHDSPTNQPAHDADCAVGRLAALLPVAEPTPEAPAEVAP